MRDIDLLARVKDISTSTDGEKWLNVDGGAIYYSLSADNKNITRTIVGDAYNEHSPRAEEDIIVDEIEAYAALLLESRNL